MVRLEPGAPIAGDACVIPRRVSAAAEHVDAAPRYPHALCDCTSDSGWIVWGCLLRRLKKYAEPATPRAGNHGRFCEGRRKALHGLQSRQELTLRRYGGQPSSGLMNRSVWIDDHRR